MGIEDTPGKKGLNPATKAVNKANEALMASPRAEIQRLRDMIKDYSVHSPDDVKELRARLTELEEKFRKVFGVEP
jgi:polyhydroxyalkanoate synthesis regulator phasin